MMQNLRMDLKNILRRNKPTKKIQPKYTPREQRLLDATNDVYERAMRVSPNEDHPAVLRSVLASIVAITTEARLDFREMGKGKG